MGGSANPIKKAVGAVTGVTQKLAGALPFVGEPLSDAIGSVSKAVGVTSEPAPAAQPEAAAPAVGESTSVQTVAASAAGEAPGQSGGELEVKRGSGRLNKNVQRNRAQFNTPSANTGTAGSSIRI